MLDLLNIIPLLGGCAMVSALWHLGEARCARREAARNPARLGDGSLALLARRRPQDHEDEPLVIPILPIV